ncbi:chaperone modulator CbpM [Psychroflexus sp. CAK57W]|uniref:chaperone modulator CbpM n=1 Tax=Psychroflexus curvus TaxID=2873595 RepID=UPI001CCD0E8C|nr:chaperone modulator CbpM [Psychroflexus curvus]MBZ9627887.1 chaperone modulator CbpM [Psychroflexus curvus]MBZ9787564.1 chaperone modulator CbpM [Psychroflexus curvus]
METNKMILVEQFCSNCDINFSFINALNDYGVIEIIVVDDKKYILNQQLKTLERAIQFHYELNINIEGIDVIHNLLHQIDDLQEELRLTKNKLRAFDVDE